MGIKINRMDANLQLTMLTTTFLQFRKSLYLLLVPVGCKAKILKNTCLQKTKQTKLPSEQIYPVSDTKQIARDEDILKTIYFYSGRCFIYKHKEW